jgi:hypothetical protein
MNNYRINQKKWAQLTIFEQMANIGSEVGRAINAQKRRNDDHMYAAIDRALDLFDTTATIITATKNFSQLKELLRSKEEFLTLFYHGPHSITTQPEIIENYFLQYALVARRHH